MDRYKGSIYNTPCVDTTRLAYPSRFRRKRRFPMFMALLGLLVYLINIFRGRYNA